MNKNIIAVVILAIFGFSLFSKKSMIKDAILKKYGDLRAAKFFRVYAAIKSLNLTAKQNLFVMSQIMLETGIFSSRVKVFDLNNNASGIYFSGSAAQLANGATRGSLRPASEGGNYANFKNLDDWAKEYLRVLNKGSFPLTANTITEFNEKLVENRYYDIRGAAQYLKNLTFFYNFLIKNKL